MNGGAASGYAEVRIMNVLVRLPIPRIPVGYEFWKFGTPKPGQLYIPHNDPERKVPAFEVKKCEKNFIKASVETTRAIVRKAKNWAESDRIRDELAAMGIAIKDNKDGTTSWEVKR